jgi:hypothetical protein
VPHERTKPTNWQRWTHEIEEAASSADGWLTTAAPITFHWAHAVNRRRATPSAREADLVPARVGSRLNGKRRDGDPVAATPAACRRLRCTRRPLARAANDRADRSDPPVFNHKNAHNGHNQIERRNLLNSVHRRLIRVGQWRVIQNAAPPVHYDRRRIFIRLVHSDSSVHTVGPQSLLDVMLMRSFI